ncbi:GNAT family N-acetyltransferase [Zunongwangia pacifica]|uniref:GNAT family N-acetyltransferase n=1 Tax=Zunongwangia pacifica TaxID=2911062 RepID=A0A9X1ZWE8_9FLAO|nr:GNAT family N-acetyltransferase [Zunongwangia pacifica]MCL6219703.1 GNAT family N-acetyltransferase [Zunongwangia pacifica]
MISVKNINITSPQYQQMRELRNKVLLRPLGIPDHSWEMHDARSWHFVALQDDQVIGCAVLVPSEENKTSAQLIQMAVAPEAQGKGIGQLLLKEIIAFAKRKSLQEIHCHSRQYTVNFYKKAGFTIYGDTFTEVGIPHNYMKLELL